MAKPPDKPPTKLEKAAADNFKVFGVSGLNQSGGRVYEEMHRKLRGGQRGVQQYKEMADNDPIVGAIMHAVRTWVTQVAWRIEPSIENDPEAMKWAEFVEQCVGDMSHTWEDFIDEILSMLVYGWSYFELVYKRRGGASDDPTRNSQFDDNMIGWRKIALRKQETLDHWEFDLDGGIRGMWQAPWQTGYSGMGGSCGMLFIPIEKALLFRTTSHANNPEGRSYLRNGFVSWTRAKRLQDIEGVGYERDLAGMPVMELPDRLMTADMSQDPAAQQEIRMWQNFVTRIRRDTLEGAVIPSETAYDGKPSGYKFRLLASGGSRALNIDAGIQRYEKRIAMTMLAEFIMIAEGGSRAMHTDKTDVFGVTLRVILGRMGAVINRFAIPRLCKLNGCDPQYFPVAMYGDVAAPPLDKFAQYILQAAQSGMLTYDKKVERKVREIGDLPELDEDAPPGGGMAEGAATPQASDAPTDADLEENTETSQAEGDPDAIDENLPSAGEN